MVFKKLCNNYAMKYRREIFSRQVALRRLRLFVRCAYTLLTKPHRTVGVGKYIAHLPVFQPNMPSGTPCCVPLCKNKEGYVFPMSPKLRKLWIRAVRREKWTPSPHSRVCQCHFVSSDFRDKDSQVMKSQLNIMSIKTYLNNRGFASMELISSFPESVSLPFERAGSKSSKLHQCVICDYGPRPRHGHSELKSKSDWKISAPGSSWVRTLCPDIH